jgi:hypothetical protein
VTYGFFICPGTPRTGAARGIAERRKSSTLRFELQAAVFMPEILTGHYPSELGRPRRNP